MHEERQVARTMTDWDKAVFALYCREAKIDGTAAGCYRKEIMATGDYQRFALACAVAQLKEVFWDAVRRMVAVFVRRK